MVSVSEYVENCSSQISNRLMNKVHFRVFALFYFAKDVDNSFFLSASMNWKKLIKLTWYKPLRIVVSVERLAFQLILFFLFYTWQDGKRVHCKYPPYKALGNFPKALYGGYLQCTHFPSRHEREDTFFVVRKL